MKKILIGFAFVVATLLGGYGLTRCYEIGQANAQPLMADAGVGSGSAVSTMPDLAHGGDVMAHPIQTAQDSWTVVKQFGYLWGGMIVLFSIGTVLVKRASDDHWLANEHVLTGLTGLIGTLGAILQAKFMGGSWAVVVVTLMTTVTLMIQKPVKK